MRYEELTIEGRNAVMEAFRSGKTIDKLFVQDGCKDGPVQSGEKARRYYFLCAKRTSGSDVRNRKTSGCDCLCGSL